MLLDDVPVLLPEELFALLLEELPDFLLEELFVLLLEEFFELLLEEVSELLPEVLPEFLLEELPVVLLDDVVADFDEFDLLLLDPHATIPNASIHTIHNSNPFFKIPLILQHPFFFLLFQKHVYL